VISAVVGPVPSVPVLPFDLGDAGSLAGVAIALIALYFAGRSAASSTRSAAASETSARAAEMSVDLTKAAQHRAERPHFAMSLDAPRPNGGAQLWIRMVDGPTQIGVLADYFAEAQLPLQGDPGGVQVAEIKLSVGGGHGRYEMVKNERIGFSVDLPADAVRASVKVILRCDSDDDSDPREWHHAESVEWSSSATP